MNLDAFLRFPPTDKRLRRSYFARKRWAVPGHREKQIESQKNVSERHADNTARTWVDPAIRARRVDGLKKSWTPERRKRHAEYMRGNNRRLGKP